MKTIFVLVISFAFALSAKPGYSMSPLNHEFGGSNKNIDKKKKISVGPSHDSGDLQLHFTSEKKGEVSILVMNDSGKVVLQQVSQVAGSANNILLKNVTGLAEGAYTVSLTSKNETFTTRFMIWK